jgi:hypothetical protein
MSGDDNVIGGEIKISIAFVISQFMRCLGGEIGIAGTTEHPQVLIGGVTPWRATW